APSGRQACLQRRPWCLQCRGVYAPPHAVSRQALTAEEWREAGGLGHRTPISAGQKRSTFLGLPEKLPGTGRPPGESATRKGLTVFPRVERTKRAAKVQPPEGP